MTSKRKPTRKPIPPAAGDSERTKAKAGERVQKVLAAAGLGSRRQCEELIVEGRVEIDGRMAELGSRADPLQHDIRVDGVRLPQPERLYFAVNKPVGVVCTNHDPSGRSRIIDLVPTSQRLFAVGRLDRASEGLILLTNDGAFSNEIAHPRYEVEKTYRVIVAGEFRAESAQKLLKGVHLSEGVARALGVRIKKRHKQSTELEIVLSEGRNREIRRVLARLGHKALRLKRIAIGPLRLGEMPAGAYRPLLKREISQLREAAVVSRKRHKSATVKRTNSEPVERGASSADPLPPSRRTGAVIGLEDARVSPPRNASERNAAPRPARTAKTSARGSVRDSHKDPRRSRSARGTPPTPRPPRKGKRS